MKSKKKTKKAPKKLAKSRKRAIKLLTMRDKAEEEFKKEADGIRELWNKAKIAAAENEGNQIIDKPIYDEIESEKVQNDMTRNNIMATILVFTLIGIMLYLGR